LSWKNRNFGIFIKKILIKKKIHSQLSAPIYLFSLLKVLPSLSKERKKRTKKKKKKKRHIYIYLFSSWFSILQMIFFLNFSFWVQDLYILSPPFFLFFSFSVYCC
jgi:hypothetical protein